MSQKKHWLGTPRRRAVRDSCRWHSLTTSVDALFRSSIGNYSSFHDHDCNCSAKCTPDATFSLLPPRDSRYLSSVDFSHCQVLIGLP